MKGEKIPDWEGEKYGGELVLFECHGLYGKPVYYTDGTRIPYTITIPKIASITAKDLTDDP